MRTAQSRWIATVLGFLFAFVVLLVDAATAYAAGTPRSLPSTSSSRLCSQLSTATTSLPHPRASARVSAREHGSGGVGGAQARSAEHPPGGGREWDGDDL